MVPPEEVVMRRGVVLWVGLGMLLAGAGVAGARGERQLSDEELRAEMSMNRALAGYVRRNGEPDVAESRFLADMPPWDKYEVTLYYFDMRKQISFARAFILGRPDVQIVRYEGPLDDQQIAALSARAHKAASLAPAGGVGGPAERAEDAARRAEAAADRIADAADAAERAADKAEAVSNQAVTEFHRSLRK